jgi:predicted heme/steroid binding protein
MNPPLNSGGKMFTLSELSRFDGDDSQMYIAFRGKVYDVTNCPHWRTGIHENLHFPGQDLTAEFPDAPHGEEVFNFPSIHFIGFLVDS